MLISVDQSKRSTAAVALKQNEELDDFILINLDSTYDGEKLLNAQWQKLKGFINTASRWENIEGITFEGLSFGSVGSGKDLLAGLLWYLRTRCTVVFPEVPVGIVPVTSWRSKVLSKEEQKEATKEKDGLKKACVDKLPADVKERFLKYVEYNKDHINSCKVKDWKPGSNSKVYLDSMYDLCDAYWLGKYRLSLK